MKRTVVFLLVVVCLAICVQAQSTTPQQMLQQSVAELQRNPNDNALREKIIKLAQTMRPSPAITEEARRHYVMAKTLFEGAKKPEDFSDSIAEFKSALLVAPWWPEANRDLGLALEAAQRFDEAIAYVSLYIASNPGDERVRAAQDEIYKIEARKQLAAKTSVDDARRQREEQERAQQSSPEGRWQALLRKIDGSRYTARGAAQGTVGAETLDISGNRIVYGVICYSGCGDQNGEWRRNNDTVLNGRQFTFVGGCMSSDRRLNGEISADGESATLEICSGTTVFRRER